MNQDLSYADATEIAERIRVRDVSPVEVMTAQLERIDALNPGLNAIVTLADGAMERAREAEAAIHRGDVWGPLHGVPFTVKDCIDTEGVLTTRGSRLFQDRVPISDASVVSRLKDAGGILIGKTNMPEFAFWWETDNAVFGRTENPWKAGRTCGGSSGGEASAIAAGLSPLGLGSDLGGSIREPAAFCGIVGLKPTLGLVPMTGHWPEVLLRYFHVGPLARSVRDASLAISLLAGTDGLDTYSLPYRHTDEPSAPLSTLRVAWCAEGPFAPVDEEVQHAVTGAASSLEGLGCMVEEVSLGEWEQTSPQAISDVVFAAEVDHYFGPLIAGREEELSSVSQRRLKQPKPSLEMYFDAMADCEHFRRQVARLFGEYDLLVCPAVTAPAYPHGSRTLVIGDHEVPARNVLRATVPFDLSGSPAITLPFGWTPDGMPVAVQLVARHLEEPTLIRVASALEAAFAHEQRRPPV